MVRTESTPEDPKSSSEPLTFTIRSLFAPVAVTLARIWLNVVMLLIVVALPPLSMLSVWPDAPMVNTWLPSASPTTIPPTVTAGLIVTVWPEVMLLVKYATSPAPSGYCVPDSQLAPLFQVWLPPGWFHVSDAACASSGWLNITAAMTPAATNR